MKKKHVQLGKKLMLGKETIANLGTESQGDVLGGAPVSVPYTACLTQKVSCLTNCQTACQVCGTFGPSLPANCCATNTTPAICE